jgi:hypothetical protein
LDDLLYDRTDAISRRMLKIWNSVLAIRLKRGNSPNSHKEDPHLLLFLVFLILVIYMSKLRLAYFLFNLKEDAANY